MNKQELIDRVALTTNSTKLAAKVMVEHTLAAIEHGVMRDDETAIVNFGKFSRVHLQERVRRNPKTGAPVVVPEKHTVRFKAGEGFTALVNGERDGE